MSLKNYVITLSKVFPKTHKRKGEVISIETGSLGTWDVVYKGFEFYMRTCDYELIDAIYEMLLELTDKKILMQYGRT